MYTYIVVVMLMCMYILIIKNPCWNAISIRVEYYRHPSSEITSNKLFYILTSLSKYKSN